MGDNNARRRHKGQQINEENVLTKKIEEKSQELKFAIRESTLTHLIENSLHIKAIYHIFIVILLLLLLETFLYDFIESGQINVGVPLILHGFGDIKRGAKLWLFELGVSLAFYPGLRIYASGVRRFKNLPDVCRIWTILGIFGIVALQMMLIVVPIWDLSRKRLELASSAAVMCEMFRFAMKIHATAVTCGPRCHNDQIPLPPFKHYVYFLFAPTLLYRDQYPRTKEVRWKVVASHFIEVVAIIFYNSFLWERFILPHWSDYGKEPKVDAGTVVRNMFACVIPGIIAFLCGFYCVLHAWLNAFAEMLRFGDRLFYEEWWTTSIYSRYYRAWNRVVYLWLREYIYEPLALRTGRAFATFGVFFLSAVVHEVIVSVSFGFFYPILWIEFGVIGVLLLPLTYTNGRRFPKMLNLFIWFNLFVGNGLFWSLYPMEHFARKNCPPSENDSFFVPKSWSCPEIVLKPDWKFHNPFNISQWS